MCLSLGNGVGYSVREVIQAAEKISGKVLPFIETNRREGDTDILIGSSEKANRILEWEPKYKTIEFILEIAWNWHIKLWR